MKIERIKLKDLTPYEQNAKIHTREQIAQIADSIKTFGMNDPIGIWGKNNTVVEGHGRLEALKELGVQEVDCIRLDHLTDEERKAYTLAHNKLTMNTGFDEALLTAELGDITDIDMSRFGFDLGLPNEPEIEEDVPPEAPEEPWVKRGDMFQLGNHVLLCGDSTYAGDVKRLMAGEEADLVVTDPPYNVAIESANGLTIENDDMSDSDFLNFLTAAFTNMADSLRAGGAFYVWYASREHMNFETALRNTGLPVREQLIWSKNHFTLGRSDYHWQHEPCLYGWKEGAAHYFVDDRTQGTVIEDAGHDFSKMKKEDMRALLEEIFSDKVSTTILHADKPLRSDLHPTMKPIKLIAKLIKNSTKQGELVLDLFGGSGSTIMAAEQLGRRSKVMEFDPKYAQVIIERWESFTGQEAKRINAKKTKATV